MSDHVWISNISCDSEKAGQIEGENDKAIG